MIKKMIYIDETMASSLERIAHAQRRSVSAVIRNAIRSFFKAKEVYDLAKYDERMAEYLGSPSSAVPFRKIMDR